MSNLELDLLVNLISDIIESFLNKNDFINVVKLCENDSVWFHVDRLEDLKKCNHKVLILLVTPGVEAVFVHA